VALLDNEFFQFLRHVLSAGLFVFVITRIHYSEKLKKKDNELKKKDNEIFVLQCMLQALVPEEKNENQSKTS
jgi:hypothetical protein